MKRNLKRISALNIYHYEVGGRLVAGPPDGLSGDISSIWGNASGIYGNASGLRGNVTGIYGNATGICGNLDDCVSADERLHGGVDICDLVEQEAKCNR